ncbi:uncharacterized protein DS421_4g121080 [Arachis hypogaea]|nr:uncharacterized protein DS421_4g121080 [Arachis hypogaea]
MNPVVLLLLEMPKPLPLSIAAGIAKNPYCLGCQCCSILPSPARRPQPPQSLPPLQPRSPRISPRSSPQPPQPRSPTAAQPPQPLHRQSLHRHRRRSVAVIGSCVAMIGSSLAVV